MSVAPPSPSGRMLVNFNGNSPATTSFDTGYIDVSAYAYFRISHTCSTTNHKYIVYWSTTGKAVHETITGAVKGAGSFGTDILTVQARFARFVLDLSAPSANAQLQCFFFDELGAGSLKNLGAGAKIYSLSASGVRSLVSSDASLTVTESATEIDVTLAGGGGSLWEIGASPSILVQKTPATVNNLLWQCDYISPNELLTTYNCKSCIILGGRIQRIEGDNYNVLIGGDENEIYRDFPTVVGAKCENNIIVGGYDSEIFTNNNSGATITMNNAIISCTKGSIGNADDSFIENCGLFGGFRSYIYSSGNSGAVFRSSIFGSYDSNIRTNSASVTSRENTIVGGIFHSIVDASQQCSIFGGYGNLITGTCVNSNIVGGKQLNITNLSGCFMVGDNNANTLAASVANEYTSRFSGGYRVYSNATATTGMTMAAGGSSWVAVSDARLKENFVPLDGPGVLAKIDQLPVYTYNFIGHTPRNFGPTAQDWNSLFPAGKENVLGIDQGDVLGVCLAAVKELSATTRELSAKIKSLSPS